MTADRIVFNVKGNDYRLVDDYRLVVTEDFEKGIVWIKWIGTHRDYDRIDVKKVKHEWRKVDPHRSRLRCRAGRGGTSMGSEVRNAQRRPAGRSATLIDVYESEHYPMDPPDPIEPIEPIEPIKFRMEQQNLTRKDLEGIVGSRTRIAEILNRRRGLSINMIRRLHEKLGISTDVLIRPSQIKTTRTRRAD